MGRGRNQQLPRANVSEHRPHLREREANFHLLFGDRRGSGRPRSDPALPRPTTYPSLEEFYIAALNRQLSPEVDYGVNWYGPDGSRNWRVSYCGVSEEMYAARFPQPGAVIVLGTFPADHDPLSTTGERYYVSLDRALGDDGPDSWAHHMNDRNGLDWLRSRLQSAV